MNRKNILFIPSWYPTTANPINGSFFQEQAKLLMADFNIFVGYIEFQRVNILRFIFYFFTFKIWLQIGKIDVIQPPQALTCRAYGINLKYISYLIPPFCLEMVRWLNEVLEFKSHEKMCKYIEKKNKFKPDLIYSLTAQVNGVPTFKLGKKLKLPVVMAEHVPFSIDSIPYHRKKDVKKVIESADELLVVSYDKARQILMGNIRCNPIVVGNMVDEDFFTLKQSSDKGKPKNLLIVASYNFYKDYETFFKSIYYLRKITKEKFTVTIIGIAPSKHANMWAEGAEKFRKAFSTYRLDDISTVIDFVDRNEMVKYYHTADLFVLTSIQEGLPVSVLEAMACGIPVFSTRCGGVEDFLNDACGRLFAIQDYIGIGDSIKNFLEAKIHFDNEYIRKFIVERFGKRIFRNRIGNVFRKCIDEFKEKGAC